MGVVTADWSRWFPPCVVMEAVGALDTSECQVGSKLM